MNPDVSLLFIGRDAERDRAEAEQRAIPFYGLRLEGLRRRLAWGNIRALWFFGMGITRCVRIMKKQGKGIVFGVGGYVSAPAMMAGKMLGWKLALHEQNTIPGLVNRRMAKWCDMVFVTFKKTMTALSEFPCYHTGLPVRSELLEAAKEGKTDARNDGSPLSILLIGGSQGAKKLVETAHGALEILTEKGVPFRALIQTGERNYEKAIERRWPEGVELKPYLLDMAAAYRMADLVISRAGAGSLSEIALWGLPSILVPYPYASEDHQRVNAEEFVRTGAAEMVLEKELTVDRMADALCDLIQNKEKRIEMGQRAQAHSRAEAANEIAGHLLRMFERDE